MLSIENMFSNNIMLKAGNMLSIDNMLYDNLLSADNIAILDIMLSVHNMLSADNMMNLLRFHHIFFLENFLHGPFMSLLQFVLCQQ
jgi:hypothetical protein